LGYILGGFSQKHLVTLLGAIFDRTWAIEILRATLEEACLKKGIIF
jgi:hypothetical protein